MVETKEIRRLIRERFGRRRPNAGEILELMKEKGLRNDKRKNKNKKSTR